MIKAETFATGMAMIFKAHGRAYDQDTARMYYAAIGGKLDDAGFERAIKGLIVKSVFWPAPAAILAEAEAPGADDAAEAFERVSSAVRAAGGYRFFTHEQFTALDEPTRAGIRAAGGIPVFSLMTEQQMARALKAFVAAYRAVEQGNAPRQLPAAASVDA